jgi:hypothetical protein
MSREQVWYLEVPLSEVVKLPLFGRVIDRVLFDAPKFVAVYNATLDAFREERKIKNPANPFPNMKVEDGGIEMPFWNLSGGVRRPVIVRGYETGGADVSIAPRGSMVTFLARAYLSDIFIHGLGGGKYDPFVDAFAERYLGVQLPKFVVASATRYMFPEQVKRFTEARELKAKYKELVSHTENYFSKGLFSDAEEADLAALVAKRKELLTSLQGANSAEARSIAAHALNGINRQVKSRIEDSSIAHILKDGAIDESTFARWTYRECPLFL